MSPKEKPNTEQLILEAAEEEFFDKGFDGARTTVIAEKAGVTHAMLHYYYRTKEQLFERVVTKNIALLADTVTTALGSPDMPVMERLRSGITSHFNFIESNPRLPKFLINEILSHHERYQTMFEKIKDVATKILTNMQKVIDEAADRGEIERVNATMLLMSIISLNIFPFLTYPLFESLPDEIFGGLMSDKDKYFAMRREENIETMMRRIKKK